MGTEDDGRTMGVEEEFFLVDQAGRLVTRAEEALAQADDDVDVKPELMRCQVESATGICRSATELREELTALRTTLHDAAAGFGARLVASGTVPHRQHDAPMVGPGSRYQRMAEMVGPIVFGGMTCGCHVHVGVSDRADAVKVCNHLRPWLPVLLALSANSPFLDGMDSSYASTRHLQWSRWPCAGPTPYLESADHYEELVTALLSSGAALDRKMVYWDVRPSEHQPTVEVRVADIQTTVDEAVLLGVLVRALVARALDNLSTPAPRIPSAVIRAGMWRAAKDGLEGHCPDPQTGEMRKTQEILNDFIKDAGPDAADVTSTMDYLRSHGGGATRQRKSFAKDERLDDVLNALSWSPTNKPTLST